jgi:hypothetical protein
MNKTFGLFLSLRFFRFIVHPSAFSLHPSSFDHTSLPPEGVPASALRLG